MEAFLVTVHDHKQRRTTWVVNLISTVHTIDLTSTKNSIFYLGYQATKCTEILGRGSWSTLVLSPYPQMQENGFPSYKTIYEHLPTRVTMYFPFSRSYTVFNCGFLHFDTYHAVNITKMKKAKKRSKIRESSLNIFANQPECSLSDSAVLCKMNAPNAQSSGIFSTWLAYPILLKRIHELSGILKYSTNYMLFLGKD